MKIIATVRPIYKINISDWHDENESTAKMIKRVKDELHDISVFGIHCDYSNLEDVDVDISKHENPELLDNK